MTRRMNFALAYDLRRRHNHSEHPLSIELQKRIGFGWYVLFWLSRKISRPVKKLERKLKSNMAVSPHQQATQAFQNSAHRKLVF